MSPNSLPTGCIVIEGSWKDFRDEVKKVEPELFQKIEQIDPNEKYKLLKIAYPYGEKITNLGSICIPNEDGGVHALYDSRTSEHYKKLLDYCPTPLILQLKNSSEVFVEAGDRIIPLNVFKPGDLYGLFEIMVPLTGCPFMPCWSVTSGARSAFMGAKITDAVSHKRLRSEFGIPEDPPAKLVDQWEYLKIIANRSLAKSPWVSEVLIFTRDWFVPNENDINWLRFHHYLAKKSWHQSRSMRIRSEFSIMWETFNSAVGIRRLKPTPYTLSSVMHNLFLANSAIPGFKPADNSELLLPTSVIENAYESVYQLKDYAPIVMVPVVLGKDEDNSIYYSLAYPTLLEGTPAIRKRPNIIVELRDIRKLMLMLDNTLEQHHDGHIFEFTKNTKFNFFHTEIDKFGEISHSKEIIKTDPLIISTMKRFKNKIFPYQGPFFHGFIQISKKPLS